MALTHIHDMLHMLHRTSNLYFTYNTFIIPISCNEFIMVVAQAGIGPGSRWLKDYSNQNASITSICSLPKSIKSYTR